MERFGEDWYETKNGAPERTLNEPTFWEFVQAIIKEGENLHHEILNNTLFGRSN